MDLGTARSRMRARRSAGPWATDIGVALLVQGAVSMPWIVPRDPRLEPASLIAYLLTTLTVVPLVWRRRAPARVFFAVIAAQTLYGFGVDGPGQTLPYTGLVALYTVAALSPSPTRQLLGALALAVVFPSTAFNTGEARELAFSLTVFAAAYAFGRFTHTRQAYTEAVEDRARQLELTHRIEAERAAALERARIAREMHDILSHAVSLMIVQAEAGPVAVRTAPERAEAAFDAISETGRDAMVQLRRMLGVLREDGGGPERAPRSPQPLLAELPHLIARVSDSGPDVTCTSTGPVRPLPLDVQATVYRIVQEALTNVVRHAAADSVSVQLAYSGHEMAITVTDDGRGPGASTTGHGLAGIRERAAAHGGTARTGAGPDGRGFRVLATLPLVPSGQGVGK